MNFFEGRIRREGKLYFHEVDGGVKLEIPGSLESKISSFIGKNIYLGVRPEHISIYDYHHGTLDAAATLRVDISEPMGNEVYLYFNSPTAQIVARVSTPVDPKPGSEIKMYFDTTRAKFFDKETESSLLDKSSQD